MLTFSDKSLAELLSPIMRDLQANQKPARQIHIYGVIQTSMALAQIHGVELEKVVLAAALHDCAKHVSRDETLALLEAGKISLSETDMQYPAIWHGAVGARLAKDNYGVTDPEVLDAVEHHTLGHEDPSDLLQIIMCADMIEPSRDFLGVGELRSFVRNDLREGLLAVLKRKINDIMARGQSPHPRIYDTLRSLEN